MPDYITPVLIPRKGSGYHDTEIDAPLPSATAIRSALLSVKNHSNLYNANFTDSKHPCIDSSSPSLDSLLSNAMPEEALAILKDIVSKNAYLDTEDFAEILGYRLLSLQAHGYSDFADCTEELSNKIANNLKDYTGFDAFCQALKSKDLTYTRISRSLLHILLDITNADYDHAALAGYVPYLRILGFRKDSSELLSSIKKEASLPLISKVADAASLLSPEANIIFEKDLYASALYHQLLTTKKGQAPMNDYTNQIVIV